MVSTTRVEIFVEVEDKKMLEHMLGKSIEEIAEGLVARYAKEKYTKVLNKCMDCGQDIMLYVSARRAKYAILMRKTRIAQCNHCNQQSSWRRVK